MSPPLPPDATLPGRAVLRGVEAVVFDLGGVLVDFGPERALPWGETDRAGRITLIERLREAGGDVDAVELERWLFEPWREGYERRYETRREESWLPHLANLRRLAGIGAPSIDREVGDRALLQAWFAPYGETIAALPGARETLEILSRRGYRLGLVSNVPLPGDLYRRFALDRFGLSPWLESVRFSHDGPSRKPDAGMLREVLAELGVAPDRAVMVGDRRVTDVAAARAAGTRAVRVADRREAGPEADLALGSVAELPAFLPGPG